VKFNDNICNSAPPNLSHCHKNSQIEASTSCLSIRNILGGGLSEWLCCGKRQGAAYAKAGPFVGPLPAKGYLIRCDGCRCQPGARHFRSDSPMVGDAFDRGILNPLRRKFSAAPKQKILLIGELRSTRFKEFY
jgi:hypothetical protein